MTALVRYDSACRAIAECKAMDEIKDIRDKALAMAAYAKQAKNRTLEIDAAEIRLRAERRLGQMMAAQPKAKGKQSAKGFQKNPLGTPTLSDAGIDKNLADRARKLAELSAPEFEQRAAMWRSKAQRNGERITTNFLYGSLYPKAVFTGENEWHTPHSYIERVREFLGEIDLDPASSPQAQKTVKARRFYTAEQDGLDRKWHGRVYLNPPYSRELLPLFAAKLVDEYMAGNVSEAVCLTHNFTDTEWFHLLANHAAAICFTRGRVKFADADGNEASPTQGQTFFYFGRRHRRFAAQFKPVGLVVTPVARL